LEKLGYFIGEVGINYRQGIGEVGILYWRSWDKLQDFCA
jgi:hypothetical protein